MERAEKILYFSSRGVAFPSVYNRSTILTEKTDIRRKLLLDANKAISSGGYAAVTVIDGMIVSAAVVLPSKRCGGELEMTVETAPEYRRCGYAADNAVALSRYISEKGKYFYYLVRENNIASLSLAKKLGLLPVNINKL